MELQISGMKILIKLSLLLVLMSISMYDGIAQNSKHPARYEIVYGKLNWREAESDALNRGGHLATITNQLEWDLVVEQLGTSLNDLLWIGGFKNDQGQWSWVTGEKFSFSRWAGSAPNNIYGNENYLQIVTMDRGGSLGEWNDHSDSSSLIYGESISGYLLEKPIREGTALAVAEILNGSIVGLNVIEGGQGYENAPNVRVIGGSGDGAIVQAFIDEGKVSRLEIISAGNGYTILPIIWIDPPNFAPKMSIRVKQVEVNLQLVVGKRYTIESSQNFVDWQQTGPLFVAEEEFVSFKFDTDEYGNYYRVVEQP